MVVPSRTDALAVYEWYVARGEPEHWIKDLKHALRADRLSDHRCWANAFRVVRHAAASWLLHTLRRWLAGTEAASFPFDPLRLLTLVGRVRELADRPHLPLPRSQPPRRAPLASARRQSTIAGE